MSLFKKKKLESKAIKKRKIEKFLEKKEKLPPRENSIKGSILYKINHKRKFKDARRERQKLKITLGNLTEKEYKKYFTTTDLVKALTQFEKRLDILITHMKLVPTYNAARQLILHGHVDINGKVVRSPSVFLKQGDVITINNMVLYRRLMEDHLIKHQSILRSRLRFFSRKFNWLYKKEPIQHSYYLIKKFMEEKIEDSLFKGHFFEVDLRTASGIVIRDPNITEILKHLHYPLLKKRAHIYRGKGYLKHEPPLIDLSVISTFYK
jgi:ribosomal protein S4